MPFLFYFLLREKDTGEINDTSALFTALRMVTAKKVEGRKK